MEQGALKFAAQLWGKNLQWDKAALELTSFISSKMFSCQKTNWCKTCDCNKFLYCEIPELKHTTGAVTGYAYLLFSSTVRDPNRKSRQPLFAPAPAEGLGVADKRQKDAFVNFPQQASGILNFYHWVASKKTEKFAEPNQFTKRFWFDCRARVRLWNAEADIL